VVEVAAKRPARTACSRSRLLAAMMRTSVFKGGRPPTRSNSPDCNTRSIFAWVSSGSSPTSSRNSVPPSACSNRPARRAIAPVNAPFSCPNNSLSTSVPGRAAQFTATNKPLPPAAALVDRAGHQLLARAGFAAEQHRGRGGGDQVHLFQHRPRAGLRPMRSRRRPPGPPPRAETGSGPAAALSTAAARPATGAAPLPSPVLGHVEGVVQPAHVLAFALLE